MGLDHGIVLKNKCDDSIVVDYCFRKFNALQGYFEREFDVQNCKDFHFGIEVIKTLHDISDRILENKDTAKTLLPTCSGFFYGSLEYGDWYYEDVATLKKATADILEEYTEDEHELIYWCWW